MRRSIWWLGGLVPLGVTVAFLAGSVSAQTPVESATARAINDTNKAFAQASPPTTIVGRATADAVRAEKQNEAAPGLHWIEQTPRRLSSTTWVAACPML